MKKEGTFELTLMFKSGAIFNLRVGKAEPIIIAWKEKRIYEYVSLKNEHFFFNLKDVETLKVVKLE